LRLRASLARFKPPTAKLSDMSEERGITYRSADGLCFVQTLDPVAALITSPRDGMSGIAMRVRKAMATVNTAG
jgi:hypothetical protein